MGYHTLSHHGKRPEMVKQLEIIESYYIQHYAEFISLLKKLKDEHGQPLIDSTIVMFGSGMGNSSSHSSRKLPIIVAGGGFKHGAHHNCPKPNEIDGAPLCNLYVTFLQQMGLETDKFHSSQGDFNHLML